MRVTDDQVAALHSQLAGEPPEEHLQLFNKLDETDNVGYAALLAAGLFEAIQRRFAQEGRSADRREIVDFIATAREKDDEAPDTINPDVAERIILHALGQGTIADIDDKTVLAHQIILLAALVAQEHYTKAELEAFMSQIRADAEEMLE
ncbi:MULTISPECIES: hypothetical protein [Actinomadura]|uniref:Uncharacterized protein n=1 Tax=Actinomadura madurae TaxID=1993 RepID=A0A1I5ALN4_9ACTN|nr:hypothetical protein [Actinomadura madurae]SFN63357.1 hypothetical protein SAMN04489713_102645 [Actinomadura madurae]